MIFLPAFLLTVHAAVPAAATGGGELPVLRAMTLEMERSVKRLKLGPFKPPYFLSYTVTDTRRLQMEAGFGAVKDSFEYASREMRTDLRVGSRDFDQTHFANKDYWRTGPLQDNGVVEDDLDALRFTLWSLTDQSYKQALERLSQKRSYKNAKTILEEIPDLSTETVTAYHEPSDLPGFDAAAWKERIRKLTALFRSYPEVQNSNVKLYWTRRRLYFLDSEGRKVVKPAHDFELLFEASTQAPDGMPLSDRRRFIAQSLEDLPGFEELEQEVRRLAGDLTALSKAPLMEPYLGPILLEGQASAEFFNQLLAKNISFPRKPWVEDESNAENFITGELAGKLGQRVLSPLLSVEDDPLQQRHEGLALAGHYRFDDEGMPAQKVNVIEKGILKDIPMSRSPIKERRRSNGHGRAGYGENISARIGNVFIDARQSVPPAELKRDLLERAKDWGLTYALIARRLAEEDLQEGTELLASPVLLYKVHVADGREELVRNAQFSGAGLRSLRDIVAASNQKTVYNFYQLGPDKSNRGQVQASIIAPSVLVSEMELDKNDKQPDKRPYLKHPYFSER